MTDYKHLSSLGELIKNDDLPLLQNQQSPSTSSTTSSTTSTTATPNITPSSEESTSESSSLNYDRRTSETCAMLENTLKKVALIKQHRSSKKSTTSAGGCGDSIKMKSLSQSSHDDQNDDENNENGLHLLNDFIKMPMMTIAAAALPTIDTVQAQSKLYYDEPLRTPKKFDHHHNHHHHNHHLIIDVYQQQEPAAVNSSGVDSNGRQLSNGGGLDDIIDEIENEKKALKTGKNYLIIGILLVVNLLNYADRYSIAGVLGEIQESFKISDALAGLLQTVFICSYMLLAPLFGYLGDRYNRKYIIIFGISFWSMMTFAGSFVPENMFWLFALIRSLVGIGEASYSCVAPTIIGDLFTDEMRTIMLAIFYLAVPVGSGLGYIVGSLVAKATGDWRWALRVTPPLGLICIVLLVILVHEPERGGAEGSTAQTRENDMNNKSGFMSDIFYLLKNKSFIWTTLGFTFASFVLGGLSWWVPTYIEYAMKSMRKETQGIPLMFGIVTALAGLFGVCASSVIAPRLRRYTKKADPLVCAFGSFIAVPLLFVCILVPRMVNMYFYWFLVALAISGMCLCWTLVADITLYVVQPTRRSMASAMNILVCHLLGDAVSPYIIGAVSDTLRSGFPNTFNNRFNSLQIALYSGPLFATLSFAAYLFAALYIEDDKKLVEDFIKKQKEQANDIGNIQPDNIVVADERQQLTAVVADEDEDDDEVLSSPNESSQSSDQKLPQHHLNETPKLPPQVHDLRNEAHLNLNFNHSNSNTMTNLLEASKL